MRRCIRPARTNVGGGLRPDRQFICVHRLPCRGPRPATSSATRRIGSTSAVIGEAFYCLEAIVERLSISHRAILLRFCEIDELLRFFKTTPELLRFRKRRVELLRFSRDDDELLGFRKRRAELPGFRKRRADYWDSENDDRLLSFFNSKSTSLV